METTAGARSRCKARLRRLNVPILWFTLFCLPITIRKAGLAAQAEWVGTVADGQVEVFREAAVVEGAIRRNLAWMARKFLTRFQRRPVAVSTKFPKSRPSIKSMTASRSEEHTSELQS